MHTKTKGTIAELKVAAWLVELGWHVSFPYGDNARYDLVAEKEGKFLRIQVKYASPRHGALRVRCYSMANDYSSIRYSPVEIDYLAVYNPEDGSVYFLPSKKLNRTVLNLRLVPARNKQVTGVRNAEDFSSLN